MLVVLQTKSNHGRAQRIQLRAHQVAKFGRSEWADYPFTNDRAMLDMHFEVRCLADGCRLSNLDTSAVTLVNGEQIKGAKLVYDGDEIQAGTTVLLVTIEGGAANPDAESQAVEAPAVPEVLAAAVVTTVNLSLAETCAHLDLGDDVKAMADQTESADALIDQLAAEEKFLDAMRIRAFLLANRDAVWWGCASLENDVAPQLAADQQQALQAALEWVTDPTEELRRAAESASNEVHNQGAGGMLALAAFWSEGSIGPSGGPDVPADERLVCQGVSAALVTAAYVGDASLANDRMRGFLDKGKQVADGELPVPDGS